MYLVAGLANPQYVPFSLYRILDREINLLQLIAASSLERSRQLSSKFCIWIYQLSKQRNAHFFVCMAKRAIIANFHESAGQNVQKETANELFRLHCKFLDFIFITAVTIVESYPAVVMSFVAFLTLFTKQYSAPPASHPNKREII